MIISIEGLSGIGHDTFSSELLHYLVLPPEISTVLDQYAKQIDYQLDRYAIAFQQWNGKKTYLMALVGIQHSISMIDQYHRNNSQL